MEEIKHFNLKIKDKNKSFKLMNREEYKIFLDHFDSTFYNKSLQDELINKAIWEEFAYQIDNFECSDIQRKNYILVSTYIGQLILDLHLKHLRELRKSQGKILRVISFNSALAFHEALMQYDSKLQEFVDTHNNPVPTIMTKLIEDIPNKMSLFLNPYYICEHVYGCNYILCTLFERMMIIKFREKLKKKLFKKYRVKFKHKSKISIDKIIDIMSEENIKKERLNDLKKIFDDEKPISLTYLIKIGFYQKCIDIKFLKVLQALFYENSLNLRNNMAHLNFKNFDYFTIGFSAILLQLLLYILNNEFINIDNIDYIFSNK